jgi:hypothetical protein
VTMRPLRSIPYDGNNVRSLHLHLIRRGLCPENRSRLCLRTFQVLGSPEIRTHRMKWTQKRVAFWLGRDCSEIQPQHLQRVKPWQAALADHLGAWRTSVKISTGACLHSCVH